MKFGAENRGEKNTLPCDIMSLIELKVIINVLSFFKNIYYV